MPISFEIAGEAIEPYRGPNCFGPLLYEWVYSGLTSGGWTPENGTAERLNPFTISPLSTVQAFSFTPVLDIAPGNALAFRVTTLDAISDEVASRCFADSAGRRIALDGLTLTDLKVVTRNRVRYEEIWSRALSEDPPAVVFRFRTPTVFRERRRLVPFPLPSLVFHTLAKKWQRWSPIDLEGVQDWVADSVDLSSYRLHTRRLMGHRRVYPGFVGEAHFSLRRLDSFQRPAICALALYAEWAGVGAMTTVGFGQVALASQLREESVSP